MSHFCDGFPLVFIMERRDKKIAPSSSSMFFRDIFDWTFLLSGSAASILVGMLETTIALPVRAKLDTTRPLPSFEKMLMSFSNFDRVEKETRWCGGLPVWYL